MSSVSFEEVMSLLRSSGVRTLALDSDEPQPAPDTEVHQEGQVDRRQPDVAPMTMDEIAATSPKERRQLNIGAPNALELHRRTGRYSSDHRVSRQDQAALALDEWLRARGY